ncbi:MAG: isoprenylcysteine carboxylmethyltransferase family protein [Gemmatimonadota bacterium]
MVALRSLALRSLLWTVLPGVMAGYIPWRYFGLRAARLDLRNPAHLLGVLAIGLGALLLGMCIWEFARSGRGTLAPVDPPRELVVQGLYRYVRHPMYLSVAMILIGELLLVPSRAFLGYAALWYVAVNLFVIGSEEPALRSRFGKSYTRYAETVRRWIPSRRPRDLC